MYIISLLISTLGPQRQYDIGIKVLMSKCFDHEKTFADMHRAKSRRIATPSVARRKGLMPCGFAQLWIAAPKLYTKN